MSQQASVPWDYLTLIAALQEVNRSIINDINEAIGEDVSVAGHAVKVGDADFHESPVFQKAWDVLTRWVFEETLEPIEGIDVTMRTYGDLVRVNSHLLEESAKRGNGKGVRGEPLPLPDPEAMLTRTKAVMTNLQRIQSELRKIERRVHGALLAGEDARRPPPAPRRGQKTLLEEGAKMVVNHTKRRITAEFEGFEKKSCRKFKARVGLDAEAETVMGHDLNNFTTLVAGGGPVAEDLGKRIGPHPLVLPHACNAQSLMQALKNNKTIHELHLFARGCFDLAPVLESLVENETITTLVFDATNLLFAEWRSVGKMLEANKTLLSLTIIGGTEWANQAAQLKLGLRSNETLAHLELDADCYKKEAAREIRLGFYTNRTLNKIVVTGKKEKCENFSRDPRVICHITDC